MHGENSILSDINGWLQNTLRLKVDDIDGYVKEIEIIIITDLPCACVHWWFYEMFCSFHTFRNVADLSKTEFYHFTGFCHWPSNWF